jgi:hypothetical protein
MMDSNQEVPQLPLRAQLLHIHSAPISACHNSMLLCLSAVLLCHHRLLLPPAAVRYKCYNYPRYCSGLRAILLSNGSSLWDTWAGDDDKPGKYDSQGDLDGQQVPQWKLDNPTFKVAHCGCSRHCHIRLDLLQLHEERLACYR